MIGTNCQSCLQDNVKKALENGAGRDEINEAIEAAKKVRAGAASKMDAFAYNFNMDAAAAIKKGINVLNEEMIK